MKYLYDEFNYLLFCSYRFVCFVSIIEKFNQTIDVMMKANGKTRGDCYATYTHEAATFFLVLFVYFVE